MATHLSDFKANAMAEGMSEHDVLVALDNARIALTFYRQWVERVKPGTDYPFGVGAENEARKIVDAVLDAREAK